MTTMMTTRRGRTAGCADDGTDGRTDNRSRRLEGAPFPTRGRCDTSVPQQQPLGDARPRQQQPAASQLGTPLVAPGYKRQPNNDWRQATGTPNETPDHGYNSWLQYIWANRSSLDATQLQICDYAEAAEVPQHNRGTGAALAHRCCNAAAAKPQRDLSKFKSTSERSQLNSSTLAFPKTRRHVAGMVPGQRA